MKKISALLKVILLSLLFTTMTSEAQTTFAFANGADVGWLSQMEATGYKFYDSDGTQKECLSLLKDKGINTIRLRVWVNPSDDKINGHCSKEETVAMAVKAQNMGMRIMIDFHYSDSWADPGKQTKPAEWSTHTFANLLNDVYNHTYDVLDALKTAGVTPEWVQIGNEISGGMLWPEGSTSNWGQLAQLLNKGYDATKAINNSIKVVVHLDQGNNNSRFRSFFDNATANNVKYDVIGISYYPYWLDTDYTASIADLQYNLKDMASRYNKEVMVVEVGGDYTLVQNTYDMLVATIKAVKNVPDNKGLGVIYWEPQGEKSWSGYQLNCWQSDGKPSPALEAFNLNIEPDPTIILSGSALNTSITLGTNDGINYTYYAINLLNGTAKFSEVSPASNLWSSANFPVGIGTQNGEAIQVQPGLYNVNFNINTGAYQFTPVIISIIGDFNGSCWDSCDIDLTAITNEDYAIEYNFTVPIAVLKFRQNHSWDTEWRAPNFNNPSPFSGIAVAAGGDPTFKIPAGNYIINFNRSTRAYSFTPTTLKTNDFNKQTTSVYPNPTTNSWYFSTPNYLINNIRIFDILGKEIININPKNNNANVDVSALSSGIYLAKIATDINSETVKLIKN